MNFVTKKPQQQEMGSSWHTSRENHQIIFQEICTLIKENVFKHERCYFVSYLHKQYIHSFMEINEETSIAIYQDIKEGLRGATRNIYK